MTTPSLGTPVDPPMPGKASTRPSVPRSARRRHRGAILAGAAAAAVVGVLMLSVRLVSAPVASVSQTLGPGSSGPLASGPAASAPAWGPASGGYIADRAGIGQRVAWAREGREP